MSHIDNLKQHVPDLLARKILDLGSGRGKFLIEVVQRGGVVIGLEKNPSYIKKSQNNAHSSGVKISVTKGVGERLSYENNSFGFVNMSEIIEHVKDPQMVMHEVFRVLEPGGMVYLSVPNRFGIRDPHFHVYFVNWLPRLWSNAYLSLMGKHKEYHNRSGHQRLQDMHYYTLKSVRRMLNCIGFEVTDIRERRIKKKNMNVILPIYIIARFFYFDSFHLLLTRPNV